MNLSKSIGFSPILYVINDQGIVLKLRACSIECGGEWLFRREHNQNREKKNIV